MTIKEIEVDKSMGLSLAEGSIAWQILRFSYPMLIGLLAISIANYLSLAILRPFGNIPQAVLGYFLPLMMISMGVNFGFSVGVTSCVARARGMGMDARAVLLAHRGIFLIFLINVLASALVLLWLDQLLDVLDTPAYLRLAMRGLLTGWFITLPLVAPVIISNGALRGAGYPLLPGLSLVFFAVTLIVSLIGLTFLVPSGKEIALFLGYAYAVSNCLNLLGYGYIIRRYSKFYHWLDFFRNPGALQSWIRDSKAIFSVSLPAVAGQALTSLNLLILILFVQDHGLVAITAFAVIARTEFLLMTPVIAMQISMVPFTGQNIVRGHLDRVTRALQFMIASVGIYFFLVYATFYLWEEASGLMNNNKDVVSIVRHYFLVVVLSFIAEASFFYVASVFNGCGKANVPLILSFLRLSVLLYPFLYLGERFYGISGLAWGITLSNICICLLSFVMLSGLYKRLRGGEKITL